MMRVVALAVTLALAACAEQPVRVGSKDFAESRILAEMFALLIEEAGLTVDRHIPYGDTATVFEGLRSGSVDIYPEYTGTGLVLLGLPPAIGTADARERVAREIDRLGITVLDPLGFDSTYAVVVEAPLARDAALATVGDLQAVADDLRLVVAERFAERPEVGLQAFLDRYGLDFAEIEIVDEDERRSVYDRLIDGRFDVAVGFGTDPEIEDYGLAVLQPSGDFFPSYAAVPVVSSAALARHGRLAATINRLAGRLDIERIRSLNSAVAIEGRPAREVARGALVELGLLDGEPATPSTSFHIALDPAEVGDPMTNRVLRAARRAVPGHRVTLFETPDPVAAIFDRDARVALAPSVAQFEIVNGAAHRIETLETVAAVGSYYLQAIALHDGPAALQDADQIATGSRGTAAYKLADAVAAVTGAELVPLEASGAHAAVDAIAQGLADAAIVLAPLDSPDVAAALTQRHGAVLIDAADWWVGSARAALPFLRAATIPADTHAATAGEAVPTLAMQATVVGPAPPASVLGIQGPSTYSDELRPVTDRAVLAFNENLGPHPDIGHYLRPAVALKPLSQRTERRMNRTPGYTVLSLGIFAFLCWAVWLLVRPEGPEKAN